MPRPSRMRTSSSHSRVEAGQPGLAGAPVLPAAGEPGARHANVDVASGMALLKEAFEQPAPDVSGKTGRTWRPDVSELARRIARHHRRVAKTLIGLFVVAAVGWLPVRALLETTSTEAMINARLVTLRAPIEGEVAPLVHTFGVGSELQPGAPLLRIVNRRADRSRLDDLQRLMHQLESERSGLMAKRDDLTRLHADLVMQTQVFQEGRARQLEARVSELRSEIAAAEANREEAERTLERVKALAESGTMTKAAFEKARRDATVTAETHAALRHRLAGLEVELTALGQGTFIGDSYNDRPRSSQRADEVAQRLSDVTADMRERETRLTSLQGELTAEQRRHADLAAVDLVAPVRGSVWEILTSPGESVGRGQDLVRLLDCGGTVVTATVGEAAYNRLRVGDPARFRFRGDNTDHKGRIIGVTGIASAPANLAIQPTALAKEPYRVTVALPNLTASGQCDVGRTGRVTFEK